MTIPPDEIATIGAAVREAQATRVRQMEEARAARMTKAREEGLVLAERLFRKLPEQVASLPPGGTTMAVLTTSDPMTCIAAYHLLNWSKEAGIGMHYGSQSGKSQVFYADPQIPPYENTGWRAESWPNLDGK
jgi:hypothetical protein